jgi:hypothetical protein
MMALMGSSRPMLWLVATAAKGGIYEVGCHEGNVRLRGILAGARAQEAS